jgi:hypothetical protein
MHATATAAVLAWSSFGDATWTQTIIFVPCCPWRLRQEQLLLQSCAFCTENFAKNFTFGKVFSSKRHATATAAVLAWSSFGDYYICTVLPLEAKARTAAVAVMCIFALKTLPKTLQWQSFQFENALDCNSCCSCLEFLWRCNINRNDYICLALPKEA